MAQVDTSDKNLLAAVAGNEALGYETYKVLNKEARAANPENPGNILICPLSVETILALTFMGASGETAKQMALTLNIPNDKAIVADGFEKLTSSLKSSDVSNVRLNIANKIFMSKNYEISTKFKSIAVNSFNAECENVDFENKSAALSNMNNWVATKTEQKIPKILDDVDPTTVTVLINAVYFNGLWKNEFTLNPYPMDFHIREGETVEVPGLHKKAYYNYYEDDTLQMVELPYKGDEYSMVIVLPRDLNGLDALESKLPIDLSKMNKREVDVTIPKFKLESTIEFTDVLPKLGMVVPFSDGADFSEMLEDGKSQIKISQVIQKCFIDVNEKGTEAAAATAGFSYGEMCFESRIRPIINFRANNPFYFLICHAKLKTQAQTNPGIYIVGHFFDAKVLKTFRYKPKTNIKVTIKQTRLYKHLLDAGYKPSFEGFRPNDWTVGTPLILKVNNATFKLLDGVYSKARFDTKLELESLPKFAYSYVDPIRLDPDAMSQYLAAIYSKDTVNRFKKLDVPKNVSYGESFKVHVNANSNDLHKRKSSGERPISLIHSTYKTSNDDLSQDSGENFSNKEIDSMKISNEPNKGKILKIIQKKWRNIHSVVCMMRCLIMPEEQPIYFNADHPFLYLLIETKLSKVSLFFGSLNRP